MGMNSLILLDVVAQFYVTLLVLTVVFYINKFRLSSETLTMSLKLGLKIVHSSLLIGPLLL